MQEGESFGIFLQVAIYILKEKEQNICFLIFMKN